MEDDLTKGSEGASDASTSPPKMPGWVKALAVVAILSILVVIAVLVASDGQHGPGRHLPGGSSDDHPPAQHDR